MKKFTLLFSALVCIGILTASAQCFSIHTASTSSFCNSGTIAVSDSGGAAPYTYSWSPGGQTTSTITGLSTGTYSVTVTDNTGCSQTASRIISTGSLNYSAYAYAGTINAGDSTVLSAYCNAPATFSWAPPLSVTYPDSASTYAHPAVTTQYTVTITTACGTFTDSVLIYVQCFPISMSSTATCSSSSDGTVTVSASGGTPPYTYLWNPGGGTTATVTGLSAGNYSVTVQDATGCSSSGTVSVSSWSESYYVSGNPTSIVAGDSTLLTATSSLSATYSWAPPASVTNPTSASTYAHPIVSTEYTVTITTACGTYTDSVLINVQCFPISMSSTGTCTSSSDGTATVTASGGTPPYTYIWNPGGGTTATITGLSAGSYSVTVTDNTGCSATGVVSVSSQSESFTISGNPTTIIAGDSTLLTATSNLTATYSWAPSASVSNPASASTYAHPAVTTEYTVTITTSCGTFTDSVLINIQCFALNMTSTPSCSSFLSSYDGSATVTASGGTPPYTYIWNPGGGTTATITGLNAGNYSVTVTDNTGCSVTGVASVLALTESYSISGNPTTIIAGDSTRLTATSNLTATYSWAPPASVTNPISASTYAHPAVTTQYTVTITTACGTFTDSVLVQVQCFPISMSSTATCSSSSDGTVTVSASGGTPPYTYLWNPGGGTTATVTGLSAGNYSVTIQDATGCSSSGTVSVSSWSESYYVSGNPTTIVAGDSTLLTATSSLSATYSWAPPASVTNPTSASTYAHPIVSTEYTVTITTACGTYTDSVLINVQCFPIGMSSTATCTSSSDGTATVSPSGGTPPYTYSWNPGGGTTATITGLSAGNYSVTVEDATGCSSSGTVSVSSWSESYYVSGNPTTIVAGDSTLLTATSSLSATYSWAPPASVTNPISASTYAHPAVSTEYTVTITTACGTYTDSVLINVQCFPISMSSTATCSSSSDGTATVSPSGGTPPYTYSWNPGGGTTATITGLSAGNYSVTVEDATGCSSSGSVTASTLFESYGASGNPATILAGDSTLLSATSSLPATYSWAPASTVTYPDSNRTYAHPSVTTNYTVTITTSCGVITDDVLIAVDCFSVTLTSTSSYCSSGTATATCSGGTPPYTYSWSPGGQTTGTATGLSGGFFTVTVRDSTGCSVTGSVFVPHAGLSVSVSGNPLYINAGDSTLLSAACNLPSTFSWAPPLSVTNPDSASTYAHPPGTSEYVVTITNSCGTYIDSILIHLQCFPLIMSSTPSYGYLCSSYDGSATVIPSGGTPPYTYSWSPGGQTTSTATGLYAGNFSVLVTDATGCSASDAVSVSSASVSLTVSALPPVIISGDSSYLSASVPVSATYSWAPATGLSCTACANTWASPTISTVYTVTATDSCGGIQTGYDTVVVTTCSNNYNQSICIVTIDTATSQCEVIWGRTSSPPAGGYGSFYIYKDSAGSYGLTHTQPLDVLSDFIDPNSNPSAGPVSYELATLDSCGVSALSPPHTSIYLTVSAGVNVYILNWTAYVGFTPTLYRIFRGPSMSSLAQIDSVAPTILTYHDTLPPVGSIYVVEAVSSSGTCVPTTRGVFRPSAEISGSFSNGFNSSVLGIEPLGASPINLTIYPNPSNGLITIQWSVGSSQSSDVQISVINELGQVVYSKNIPAGNGTMGTKGTVTEQLNLSNLAAGIYTLRMQSNSGITVKKLVLMKE